MMRSVFCLTALLVGLSATVNATTFRFNDDPFLGSDAPTTPGRQVVGGEPFIIFDPATDVFSLNPAAFAAGDTVSFANGPVESLPTSGANFLVLQTLDNDANPATPFAAGTAANLIANQVTASGAGFFIYFNSGLDLPRLVYSTDLSDNTADLKIIARLTNLEGNPGALAAFTADNFVFNPVPEPSTTVLMAAPAALLALGHVLRRRRATK